MRRRLIIGKIAAENGGKLLVYLKIRGQLSFHIGKRLERAHMSHLQVPSRTYIVLHCPRKKRQRIGFKTSFFV